ncbi:tripartite tricarboxylate transporter substrate binding protein [Achromobacter aloeverae]
MNRRTFNLRIGALMAAGSLPAGRALAAADVKLPSLINLIVPFAPGGGTDQLAREFVQTVAPRFEGSNIVVENRPGANGAIASRYVSKQKNDGGSLLLGSSSTQALGPLLVKSEVDPINDLVPVSLLAETANALAVSSESRIKSLDEYIEAAKKQPMTFGSFGAGSSGHLYGLMLAGATGAQLSHIPYKGSSQAVTDLLGGHVDSVFLTTNSLDGLARDGKVRVLAVTGPRRTGLFPDVPTFSELGVKSLDFNGWFGLFASKGTPMEIARQIAGRAAAAGQNPEFAKRMKAQGYDWVGAGPQELDRAMRSSIEIYKQILSKNPIQV